MNKWEIGMLAKSLCGHDEGKLYVILRMDETYVYLADGKLRGLEHPKKKKKKHIQIIKRSMDLEGVTDSALRSFIKDYQKESNQQ